MPKILGVDRVKPENVKNYMINGDMRIAQRGTSFPAAPDASYIADRWSYVKNGAVVHTTSQDTDVPTFAQTGYLFQNSVRLNLTTPDTSIAATDYSMVRQVIEGYNWANLAQKTFTLSFWVKATATGIYSVSFQNQGQDRSYVSEYTVNTTNTWEYKTITVPASPSAGSWNYLNAEGLRINWPQAMGSSFTTATLNAWQTGNFRASANQINGNNTGATDFRLAGVMVNEGMVAAPFKLFADDIEGEISACQRYYEKSYDIATAPATNTTNGAIRFRANGTADLHEIRYAVNKRTSASMIFYTTAGVSGNWRDNTASADRVTIVNTNGEQYSSAALTATVDGNSMSGHWTADAEF